MTYNEDHGLLGIGRWSIMIHNGKWKPRNFDIPIIEILDAIIEGRCNNVLFTLPRRHGKSTLISENFCSYFMTHFPEENVILTSYGQELADEFGSRVKDIINEYGYLSPYPGITLSPDTQSKHKFRIKGYGGQMIARGAQGSIIGFGAGILIIDDPLKSMQEAESKTNRRKLKKWYTTTAKTCLERRKNGLDPAIIVIAQRLHLEDLHGIIKKISKTIIPAKEALTILRNGGSIPKHAWVDFKLPAICTDPQEDILGRQKDEVLWPSQRDYEWLMNEYHEMGSYQFNAMYQGEPEEREGNIFKREWFYDEYGRIRKEIMTPHDSIPRRLPELRYYDTATGGEHGDETAGFLSSYDGRYVYIHHLHNAKYTAGQLKNAIIRQAIKDGRQALLKIQYEPGSLSREWVSNLRTEPQLTGYNIRGDDLRQQGPKNVRSAYLEVALQEDQVKFSDQIPQNQLHKIFQQLISFTGEEGQTDDIEDSLAGTLTHWKRKRTKIGV